MAEDAYQQLTVGDQAVDAGSLETFCQQGGGLPTRLGPCHNLGDHRVIEG